MTKHSRNPLFSGRGDDDSALFRFTKSPLSPDGLDKHGEREKSFPLSFRHRLLPTTVADALLLPPFSVVRPPFLLPPTTLAPEKDGMRRGASSSGRNELPLPHPVQYALGAHSNLPHAPTEKKILMVSKPPDRLSCPRCERAIFLHGILYGRLFQ